MTQDPDEVVSSPRRGRGRLWIAGTVAVAAVILTAGIAVAVTQGTASKRGHPQPTVSPKHVALVSGIPPLDSLVLGILNTQSRMKWREDRSDELTSGDCGIHTGTRGLIQHCSFSPVSPSETSAVYIEVDGYMMDSPGGATGIYDLGKPYYRKLVSGVGDMAAASTVTQIKPVPLAPSRSMTLRGAQIRFVYRQTAFDVAYFGADYGVTADGTVTNVKGFSFDEALKEAKALSQEVIAKLPLA